MGALQPQGLEFAEAAPFTADASIVCPVPAAALFAVLRDHRRWPEWVGAGVTQVTPTSDPDYGVGSTRTVTFGRFAEVKERFVGWEEPTLWAFTALSFRPGVFSKLVERFAIEPLDQNSCRISYRMAADFRMPFRMLARPFMRCVAVSVKRILKRLRREAVRRQTP